MKMMSQNAEAWQKPKNLLLGYDACQIATLCTFTVLAGVTVWAENPPHGPKSGYAC